MCLSVYLYVTCIYKPTKVKNGIRSPATRVIEGCELTCGCWEWSVGSLQEQKAVLTTAYSFQPCRLSFNPLGSLG